MESSRARPPCGPGFRFPVSGPAPVSKDASLYFHNPHSPSTLANFSCINLGFIFGCSSPPRNSVYEALAFRFHHTDTHVHRSLLYLSFHRFIMNSRTWGVETSFFSRKTIYHHSCFGNPKRVKEGSCGYRVLSQYPTPHSERER